MDEALAHRRRMGDWQHELLTVMQPACLMLWLGEPEAGHSAVQALQDLAQHVNAGSVDRGHQHTFQVKAMSSGGQEHQLPQRFLSGQGKVEPVSRRAALYALPRPCYKCVFSSSQPLFVESAKVCGSARPKQTR